MRHLRLCYPNHHADESRRLKNLRDFLKKVLDKSPGLCYTTIRKRKELKKMTTYKILWYNDEIKTVTNNELFDLRLQAIDNGHYVKDAVPLLKGWGIDYMVCYW